MAPQHRLDALDGLRGIAALCVLLYHALGMGLSNAFLAVDFFFMLSGYVMARTYERRLSSDLGAASFLKRRIQRLWPTMFAAGLVGMVGFLLKFGGDGAAWLIIVSNLMLIPTPVLNRVFPINGPAWSIFFELIANFLHALVLHKVPTKRLVIFALFSLLWLYKLAAEVSSLDIGSTPGTMVAGLPRVLFSYTVGIILFRWWQDVPVIKVSPASAFLAMPIFFGISAATQMHYWQTDMLFIAIGCPLILAGALRTTQSWRVAAWAGALSFPLYAVHAPILRFGVELGVRTAWGIPISLLAAMAILWSQRAFAQWRPSRFGKAADDLGTTGQGAATAVS